MFWNNFPEQNTSLPIYLTLKKKRFLRNGRGEVNIAQWMLKEDALIDKCFNSTEYLNFVYTELDEKERGYG